MPRKTQVLPPVTRPGSAQAMITHTVAHGETLYRISKMYGVRLDDLMRVNQIQDVSRLETGQVLCIPGKFQAPEIVKARGPFTPVSEVEIKRLVGLKNSFSIWKIITVHHSGTLQGNARLFDRDHRRRHMGGLFYHFVIGNGSYSGDGQVEVGWRWKQQVKANRPYDIQICVVGDFSREEVSEAQLDSLVKLISLLREEYGISLENIRKHEDIRGKHTECPGKNFPFARLISRLANNQPVLSS